MQTLFYYLGLAALFTHEMDAVGASEWKLLYGLRSLPDDSAYAVFLALHVPLYVALLWLSHHRSERVRAGFRAAVAAFLVVHAALHFRLSSAADYGFEGPLSNALILTAAGCGFIHLAIAARERWARRPA